MVAKGSQMFWLIISFNLSYALVLSNWLVHKGQSLCPPLNCYKVYQEMSKRCLKNPFKDDGELASYLFQFSGETKQKFQGASLWIKGANFWD